MKCNILKYLSIVENDIKLYEEVVQDIVDCLKEMFSWNLLKQLVDFKGHAFLGLCGRGLFISLLGIFVIVIVVCVVVLLMLRDACHHWLGCLSRGSVLLSYVFFSIVWSSLAIGFVQ